MFFPRIVLSFAFSVRRAVSACRSCVLVSTSRLTLSRFFFFFLDCLRAFSEAGVKLG